MRTRNKYLNNSQDFESLLHNCCSGQKNKYRKGMALQICRQAKMSRKSENRKMNELRIHTIDDLKIHVLHHGNVPIRGSEKIYSMDLQALQGKPPSYFKDRRKAKNPYHLRYGEGWVEKMKSSTAMSKFSCITYLIRFMTNEE